MLIDLEDETINDFMHNDAKYPLISRAIHKPRWSIQNLRPLNNQAAMERNSQVLSHRSCNCFGQPNQRDNNDNQQCKQHAFKREYNSYRPPANQRNRKLPSVDGANRLVEVSLMNSARLNISSLNKYDSQSCTFDIESINGKSVEVLASSRESKFSKIIFALNKIKR